MQGLENDALHQDIIAATDPLKEVCFELADKIWSYAELGYGETRSAEAQASLLEANGFTVTRGIGGIPTAFVAEAGEGEQVVAFLGEYDALDGLSQDAGIVEQHSSMPGTTGHGCGHNLLGAASLLAAWAAVNVMKSKGIPGRVRYYGCPAEEFGSGKAFMAKAGCFAGVDFAFCWHPGDVNRSFNMRSLSNVGVKFRFFGTSSHAGAAPEKGRSALDAAELMSVGVNYMREHMPSDYRVHFAYQDAGGRSPNVVPNFVEVSYLIRATDNASVKTLFKRVRDIADGAALMTQTRVEVEVNFATSNVLGNRPLAERMGANMSIFGAPDFDETDYEFAAGIRNTLAVSERKSSAAANFDLPESLSLCNRILPTISIEPLMHGSTDVGDVSWIVPTAQCMTACFALGTPFHSWQLVAQGKSPAAHKGMLLAAQSMAATAIDVLTDVALAEATRADFERRVGTGYDCPIPADVIPPPQRAARTHIHAV